jgi:serine protease Do
MHPQLLNDVFLLFGVVVALSSIRAIAAPPADLAVREEAAFRGAVAAVAPSVVAIETIGGLEKLDELLVGTGPSSGVIVSDDGYIASSTFNFAHRPASIIVTLADGTRLPAQLVARDEARKIVLLKVDAPRKLPVPTPVGESELSVGQWSVAIGRTFEIAQPNVSVGVVSAVHRIWGKAVQTDAKISPANYGGALVDLRGRVIGVLVPLSPNEREDISGAEWYDSGIGFAVPLDHINRVLPRLKAGETLKAGLIGVRFRGSNVYADPPLIARARAGGPAFEAGLRDGDLVTAADGKSIVVQAQLMEQVHRRYAGDVMKLAYKRGDKTLEGEVKLVDHLDPYQRPFFGLLAERSAEPGEGAKVRYVFVDSPAAKAGLAVGDIVVRFQTAEVKSRDDLRRAAAELEPGRKATVEYVRAGTKHTAELVAVAEPVAVPDDVPLPAKPVKADKAKPVSLKIPEFENTASLYVPPQYDDAVPHGLVVLLHPQGGFADNTIIDRWRDRSAAANLLLLVPKAVGGKWAPTDLDFVKKTIDLAAEDYRVDGERVVAVGYEEGGTVAMRAAARMRERIRGVAVMNVLPAGFTAESDPLYPTSFFAATSGNFSGLPRVEKAVEVLQKQKYPVVVRKLKNDADDWDEAGSAELLRWIEMLDRI